MPSALGSTLVNVAPSGVAWYVGAELWLALKMACTFARKGVRCVNARFYTEKSWPPHLQTAGGKGDGRKTDDGFRGVAIVHANDFLEAVMECNLHGCNPHGQVQGVPVPPQVVFPKEFTYRILDKGMAEKAAALLSR